MIKRLGLKLDFETKIWWLPEENRVKWNEEEKKIKPKEDSEEERVRTENEKKLHNKEEKPVNNRQWGEIPTITPTNNTLPKTVR